MNRRLLHLGFLVAWSAVAFSALVLIVGWQMQGGASELPLYGELPGFSLTNMDGSAIGRDSLKGRVWVANFFYSRCPQTCPLQTPEIARLQGEFKGEPDLLFVSISVDPENDTPEVLRRYARRFGADAKRWYFLTGEKRAIVDLSLKGFRLAFAERRESALRPSSLGERSREMLGNILLPEVASADPGHIHGNQGIQLKDFGISHSSRFVLVDRKSRIRGYYHSYDPESLAKLRQDIRRLL